jgi:hypothetical protein
VGYKGDNGLKNEIKNRRGWGPQNWESFFRMTDPSLEKLEQYLISFAGFINTFD